MRLSLRQVCFLLTGLIASLASTSCSVKPQLFGKTELDQTFLKYRDVNASEWYAYREGELHPNARELTLEHDPSRGIGLKEANSMGGGEASIIPTTPLRVFLLMGQSNMVGHGRSSKLTEPYNQAHPRIRIWSRGKWQYMVPKRNFGPEVTFAHEMANHFPNDTIGIIKVAVGGTGMNAWKPDWEWSEASKTGDALKGSLYRDMINAVSEAYRISNFEISGFIWKQGGRDGKKIELAESYQERFIEFVNHMRNDLGVPELPVFVLTYFNEAGLEEHRKILDKVRPNAYPLYLSKARVADYLDNAFPVYHGRLPTVIDQVHFNTEGQLMLGKMTAQAVSQYYRTFEARLPDSPSGKIVDPPIPK
ncbi:MAG: sialate O-acetylesterase [Verrucomicrobiales bacterium]|nr:sialate O-acetylesterase [Verrucomicrobiales bacterium]